MLCQEGVKIKMSLHTQKDHYAALEDVHVNLENRNHAFDEYGYGPLNPKEPSDDFWKEKAELFKTTIEEAKKSRCGNCAAFNQSKEIMKRIADGLGPAGKIVAEKADLGFCEMFKFKCAAERTCDAWLVNGPIMEEAKKNSIWKYNSRSGMWDHQRNVEHDTKDQWLGIYKKDEPNAHFHVSSKKPKHNPTMKEEAPANSVGGEKIAGLGVGPQGEPGRPAQFMPMMRRKTPRGKFAGHETFIVPSKLYNSLREAKKHKKHWRKYLDEDDSYHDIREYARKKKKGPIIVEDEITGACMYVRYGDLI